MSAFPADARLGLDGFLSPQATRLACLAAASWSFDVSSDRLEEIAGIRIDDETIRRHCHKQATQVIRRRDRQPPTASFRAAQGELELLTDGVLAPSRDGWIEVKMIRFQKRVRGEAAEVKDWANRDLPAVSASVSYATTGDCQEFSGRWQGWAEGLGIQATTSLTILGDGAAWIWRAATEFFPAAEQVLDIFHASQHIAATAVVLHGENTAAATDWHETGRARLLADGWPGLLDHIGTTSGMGQTEAEQGSLSGLVGYFAKHTERVGYFGRLRTGRSIGSGSIEGLAKRMGRRLKVAGRGWCSKHIDGMAALIATVDTPEWAGLWDQRAA